MAESSANLKAVFCQAREIRSANARARYLDEACDGDPSLRKEVEELLLADEQADGFLENVPFGLAESPDVESPFEREGMTIGRYKLLRRIAEGGMGIVYVAEQQSPINRRVALKIIRPGLDSREVVSRFELERQVLAIMDHPHIAHVFDVGTTESGRPYFVMELVKGIPITEFCDQRRLSPHDRLGLFVEVCQAIQHAHQKGIIHRDIKPSNVLVTVQDGKFIPKVIDFGVAKAINQHQEGRAASTHFSQVIGTPLYMSPEQADSECKDVDTRTDVYSLGVLLYELLTGSTPIERDRLKSVPLATVRRIVRDEEPPRPSVRVSTLRGKCDSSCPKCRGEPRRLSRALRGELDCIVMTAIDKDRSRRYDSAGALAADVQRYLNSEPIQARPATVFRYATKWLRRHPVAALVILVLHLFGALLAIGATWHFYQMRAALATSIELRAKSEANERELTSQLYATDVGLAWQAWLEGDLSQARNLLERHVPDRNAQDLRGFEWRLVRRNAEPALKTLAGHASPILTADVSSDSRWLASADRAGEVRIWDFATGRHLISLRYSSQEVTSVAFSPDNRLLATAGQDQTVRLWNTLDWREVACLSGHSRTVCCVAWSRDGKRIASSDRDHRVRIWDVAAHREVLALPEHADVVRCVAWSPDGKQLATAGGETTVRLWDAATGTQTGSLEGHSKGMLAIAFDPLGRYLASGGYDQHVVVHDVARREVVTQSTVSGAIWSIAFSPNGQLLFAGAGDGQLAVFDARNLQAGLVNLRLGIGHGGAMRSVLTADHGRRLVTASEDDRTVKIWNADRITGWRSIDVQGRVLAVNSIGDTAAIGTPIDGLQLKHLSRKRGEQVLPDHARDVVIALFAPDGQSLAARLSSGQVRVWGLANPPIASKILSADFPVESMVYSPRGTILAGGGDDGRFTLWHVDRASPGMELRGTSTGRVQMTFSPDEKLLATGSNSGMDIDIWNTESGTRRMVLRAAQPVAAIAFCPDGATLAVGGEFGGISLINLGDPQTQVVLRGHEGAIRQLVFSASRTTMASLDSIATIRLWHMPTRRPLFTLFRHYRPLEWIAFVADARLLAAESPDASGRGELIVFEASNASTPAVTEGMRRRESP